MRAEHWPRVRQLYLLALEVPERQREAWLAATLAREGEEVGRELRRMLETGGSDLEPPSAAALTGAPAEPAVNLTGRQLGVWRIDHEIGRGGLGVVYAATDIATGEAVAVKVLQPGLQRSAVLVERFRREAEAAARLDHPAIARVLRFGEEGGLYFLVMQLIDGLPLSELIEAIRQGAPKAPPDLRRPEVAAALLARIADALGVAHRERIVHRDVKPQNILIDAGGLPHVVDFGLAKDLDLDSLSRTGEVFGTPYYMSPEQALARRHRVDHRTDVYSLGAVMYELLTLQRPFDGASSHEIFFKIVHDDPPPIRSLNPKVPREIALICAQAMRRKPEHRYESMESFAADLRRFVAGERVHARPLSPVRRFRNRMRRPRALAAAAGAILALGAIGGAGIAASRSALRKAFAMPAIEIALSPGSPECEVLLLRQDRIPPELASESLGRTRGGRFQGRFEPGSVRITVADGAGGLAEFDRLLGPGSRERIDVTPVSLERSEVEWVRVSAGTFRYTDHWSGGSGAPIDVEVPAFRIERSCVTNAQYAAYLQATGRAAPQCWPPGVLEDPSLAPPRWDALPAAGMSLADARAFCEWSGARLPTAFEWQRAALSLVSLTEALSLGSPGPFVLGHPQFAYTPAGQPSTYLAYLAAVQPAREGAPELGDLGLCHMFGNVWQWTSSPWLVVDGDGARYRHEFHFIVGAPWHATPTQVQQTGSGWFGLTPAERGESFEIGFRRARSDAP